ncbi:hypothetical protein Tco_0329122 [Tanacetum coccineum]
MPIEYDKYSIHELNDAMVELGYVNNDDPIYYHYMILGTDLEIGLRALGQNVNDIEPCALPANVQIVSDPEHLPAKCQLPFANKGIVESICDYEQERARDDINEPQETLVKGETIAEDKEDSSTKEGDKVEWVRHSNSGQEHDHDPIPGELDVIDIDNFESGTDSEDDGIVKIRRKKLREIKKANETEVKERVRLYLIKTRRKLFLAKNVKGTKFNDDIQVLCLYGIVDQIETEVFKAKSAALNQVKGDYSQQYTMLRDYCLELRRANPVIQQ